ncbi:MAG: hypothetical protein ABF289_19810 [Clostridiales bacterium]
MDFLKRIFSSNNSNGRTTGRLDINNDTQYYKFFISTIGPRIFEVHSHKYFVCCAFCVNLNKSNCHDYCYSCSKKVYNECSSILPESFSFVGYHYNRVDDDDFIPWIFRTPCTAFERLTQGKYFKNFIASDNSITIGNFEALEGIFMGLCRGKKPCQICPSVNQNIFNNCSQEERLIENVPCNKLLHEIAIKYRSIMGMVKYVD